jgi:heme oxygenase (biliverdin-IX-beta and delta-forming)
MLIDDIREATGEMHRELDNSLLPEIQQISRVKDYAVLLRSFYGFFKPVMDKVDLYLDGSFISDYDIRRKPAAILQDLNSIGENSQPVPFAQDLPEIYNTASAAGAFYVLEGSTLGGVYLSKLLADQTGLDRSAGLSFFYGYGKESRSKWEAFISALHAQPFTREEALQVIATARTTFACFKSWLDSVHAA